jgi:hypothetical protein
VIGARTAARSAVKHHCRLAVRISAKLPIEAVAVAHVQHAGLVRLELRIKSPALRGLHVHQKLNSS